MSTAPGDKAKLINALDTARVDSEHDAILPTYSIELAIALSPQKRRLAGVICVFRNRHHSPDLTKMLARPNVTAEQIREAEQQAQTEQQTQQLDRPMIRFCKEVDGRDLAWACEKVLKLFDDLGGDASISLAAPSLRVMERISKKSAMKRRSNPREMFKTIWNARKLLEAGLNYDPWGQDMRRGRIGARERRKG